MTAYQIKDRLVLHFCGFELASAEYHYQRFLRECGIFQNLWNVEQEIGSLEYFEGVSGWQTMTHGPEWCVSTRFILMEWGSFLKQPGMPVFWRRVAGSMPGYFAHYLTLAPWYYFKVNWRYGLFFIFPVLALFAIGLISLAIVWGVNGLMGGLPVFLLGTLSLGIFLAVFRILGHRWKLPLELDLMCHIHSMALRQNDISLSRIAAFSSVLMQEIKNSIADEISITMHSFGSVYAVAALANALREKPDLLKDRKLTLTAIGSNLLHVGLMSQGDWLRDDLELVLGNRTIQWVEIYATDDPMCFYKSGPDIIMKNKPANPSILKRVRFSRMIGKKHYREMQGRFFRLHRQLIMANECHYFYDFYLLVFGPRNIIDQLQGDQITEI